jgi:hypothetical protein
VTQIRHVTRTKSTLLSREFQSWLEERDGVLKLVQSTEVHNMSDEQAKEDHLGSEDDNEEDLANRMDECEV